MEKAKCHAAGTKTTARIDGTTIIDYTVDLDQYHASVGGPFVTIPQVIATTEAGEEGHDGGI